MSEYNPYDGEFDRDMDDDEWAEVSVDKVVAETELALLVRIDGKDIWLPKSQLDDWPDVGDEGGLLIKTWLAEEKELI